MIEKAIHIHPDLTEEQKNKIYQTRLFRGMSDTFYDGLLDNLVYTTELYKKGKVIIEQDTKCQHLYILVEGKLEVNIVDVAGNDIKIEHLVAPRAFATPHLFDEENLFPATFTALEDILLFKATQESTFRLLSSEPELMKNFLKVAGNCKACTVSRLRILSYRSIRSRFIYYLHRTKRDDNTSVMEHNQTQLAEYMGVSRPALATEMKKMADEGLIEIQGLEVKLLNPKQLIKYI